jgi:hypothetical protein
VIMPMAPDLAAWQSFYVIVGSSAAALTGLSFVVVSLAVERRGAQTAHALAAFGTPTVVHLCAAFFISAVLAAPWTTSAPASIVVGITGILGIAYVLIVIRRARRQSHYRPVLEDWIWHGAIPFVAYVAFAVAGLGPRGASPGMQVAIAAGTIVLIFCGVHNSWDSVTYSALSLSKRREGDEPPRA